jgi:hypothetical protein
LQPKTIEAYARAIRRVGNYFDPPIDRLTLDQLLEYFNDLFPFMECRQTRSVWLEVLLYPCAQENLGGYPTDKTAKDQTDPRHFND